MRLESHTKLISYLLIICADEWSHSRVCSQPLSPTRLSVGIAILCVIGLKLAGSKVIVVVWRDRQEGTQYNTPQDMGTD